MNAKLKPIRSEITVLQQIDASASLCEIPFALERVSANFPSPASDHVERVIDISELLITNKIASFLVRANSLSMLGVGIEVDDILIVDRSMQAVHQDIVIAEINNELLVKTLIIEESDHHPRKVWLRAENPDFESVYPRELEQILIWGVVTWNLKKLHHPRRKCA
jgi:DNA polymerase V